MLTINHYFHKISNRKKQTWSNPGTQNFRVLVWDRQLPKEKLESTDESKQEKNINSCCC